MIKRLVILFLAIGLCQQNSIAQDTLASLKKLNSLSTLYSNGKIKKQAYLDSIQFWLGRNEQDALFFDKDSLLKYLTLFKKIAWSDTSFSKYQSRYFVYLSNNESHKGNQGFAIYFLDKCDSFNLALKKKKTFYALELQCGFLRDAKNYKKIIALYSKNLSSFNTYPRWLEQDSISGNDALNASKFMGIVAEAYASIGDTAGLNRIIELGEQIKNVYLKKVDNKSMYAYVMTYNTLDLYFIKYFTLCKDMIKSRSILEQERNMIYADTSVSEKRKQWSQQEFTISLIKFYIANKNIDSARYYLDRLKSFPTTEYYYGTQLKLLLSSYFALKGQTDSAYAYLQKVRSDQDTTILKLSNELDGLLTAYIQAEKANSSLQIAEKEKQQKTISIFLISIASIFLIGLIFFNIKQKEKITKSKIEQLDKEAEFQILALEEDKYRAVKEEQERLGMDLHDNLSSTMASIKLNLEMMKLDRKDDKYTNSLEHVYERALYAYNIIRNKSHALIESSGNRLDRPFEERIKTLIATSLPDALYEKEITIDTYALERFDTNTKVELLKIIQEIIANILKHAEANKISILMYEEIEELIIKVTDNGKGFKVHTRRKGVGLFSIEKRTSALNGRVETISDNTGTTIIIKIPFAFKPQ